MGVEKIEVRNADRGKEILEMIACGCLERWCSGRASQCYISFY